MNREEFIESLRVFCLGEFLNDKGDIEVLYVDFDNNKNQIICGCCTNVGIIPSYRMDYDNDFSLDMNLQTLVEELYEKHGLSTL